MRPAQWVKRRRRKSAMTHHTDAIGYMTFRNRRRGDPAALATPEKLADKLEEQYARDRRRIDQTWKAVALFLLVTALALLFSWQDSLIP